MTKLSIIGAGNVGATLGQLAQMRGLAEVVMVDIVEGLVRGKALDLAQAAQPLGCSGMPTGTADYEAIADSDVVVVTAGIPRKPGMSRDDLVRTNARITREVAGHIRRYAPDTVVVMVTNPLDVMCHVMLDASGKPPVSVIGMAGVLDSARFSAFIAMELGVSPMDVRAMVLGGHGDQMVPLVRFSTVHGVPVSELIDADRLEVIVDRTRKGGAEIVGLLKTGSAYYAPASSALAMVECLLSDNRRILPCSVLAQGQYGLSGVYVGLPAILGRGGLRG